MNEAIEVDVIRSIPSFLYPFIHVGKRNAVVPCDIIYHRIFCDESNDDPTHSAHETHGGHFGRAISSASHQVRPCHGWRQGLMEWVSGGVSCDAMYMATTAFD